MRLKFEFLCNILGKVFTSFEILNMIINIFLVFFLLLFLIKCSFNFLDISPLRSGSSGKNDEIRNGRFKTRILVKLEYYNIIYKVNRYNKK